MQQALQAALAKIQADVDSLSGFQQQDRQEGMEVVVEEEARRPLREGTEQRAKRLARAQQAHAGQAKDRSNDGKVFVSRRHKKLVIDKPQDSSDDTEEEGSERQSDNSNSEQTSDGHSDLDFSGDEEALLRRRRLEDDHGEEWQPDASAFLQQLLRSIKLDERTEMLEDLDWYYSQKQRQVQDEDKQLNGIEEELTNANTRLEKDSMDVKRTIDSREVGLYRVLRQYDRSLRELAAAPPELPPRLEEIKDGLLKAQGMDLHELKGKSAEVLAVVANIQEYLEALEQTVQLQEGRLEAYQHTERKLAAAVESVSDAPLKDEVVAEVINEVVKARQTGGEGQYSDSSSEEEICEEHAARLAQECEDLRNRLAREGERDKLLRGGIGELAGTMHHKVRKRLIRGETISMKPTTTYVAKEKPPWESHALFSAQAEEQYEADLEHIRGACDHAEHLIRSFQEVQVLCAGSAHTLEEGVRKLTEAAQQSKKHVAVGSLPEEEDPEEALIRDLREANHEITLKQEADHNAQMLKLEALEARILQDLKVAEEKVKMLEWAHQREKDKHNLMTKEIAVRKEEQRSALEKLQNFQPLPFDEEEAAKARHLQAIEKLQHQYEVAHDRMVIALKKAEATVKMFKQARSVGVDLASKAAWKQLESGESCEAHEAAISEWWQMVSDFVHEDQFDMEHVDQMVEVLRQEETGAPVALGRDRTSIVEVQRPKLVEQTSSERLVALMAWAEEAEFQPPAGIEPPIVKDLVPRKKQRNKAVGSRPRSRGKDRAAVPKLMQARQNVRTKELLQEAKNDQEQAQELQERTKVLCAAGAALEAKAVQFLRLRGKTDHLPAELKVSFNLEGIVVDQPDDPQVNGLREAVKAKQNDFDLLAGKMRDIRTVARRGGRSILKSSKHTEELRKEVLRLCDTALDNVEGSASTSRPRLGTPPRSSSPDADDAADDNDDEVHKS